MPPVKFEKVNPKVLQNIRGIIARARWREPLLRIGQRVITPIALGEAPSTNDIKLEAVKLQGEINQRLLRLPLKKPSIPPPIPIPAKAQAVDQEALANSILDEVSQENDRLFAIAEAAVKLEGEAPEEMIEFLRVIAADKSMDAEDLLEKTVYEIRALFALHNWSKETSLADILLDAKAQEILEKIANDPSNPLYKEAREYLKIPEEAEVAEEIEELQEEDIEEFVSQVMHERVLSENETLKAEVERLRAQTPQPVLIDTDRMSQKERALAAEKTKLEKKYGEKRLLEENLAKLIRKQAEREMDVNVKHREAQIIREHIAEIKNRITELIAKRDKDLQNERERLQREMEEKQIDSKEIPQETLTAIKDLYNGDITATLLGAANRYLVNISKVENSRKAWDLIEAAAKARAQEIEQKAQQIEQIFPEKRKEIDEFSAKIDRLTAQANEIVKRVVESVGDRIKDRIKDEIDRMTTPVGISKLVDSTPAEAAANKETTPTLPIKPVPMPPKPVIQSPLRRSKAKIAQKKTPEEDKTAYIGRPDSGLVGASKDPINNLLSRIPDEKLKKELTALNDNGDYASLMDKMGVGAAALGVSEEIYTAALDAVMDKV